jgi:hypothetical protein
MTKFLLNPYAALALIVLLGVSHGYAYFKGVRNCENKAKLELIKQYEKEREYLVQIDTLGRELVKAYSEKRVETKTVYKTITKEIPNATTGAVCFNSDAGRLWNDSLFGNMSDATSGTTDEAARAFTDDIVLINAVQNFEQYTECRQQLNALIDWHEKVAEQNATK